MGYKQKERNTFAFLSFAVRTGYKHRDIMIHNDIY